VADLSGHCGKSETGIASVNEIIVVYFSVDYYGAIDQLRPAVTMY